jgi:hypothetical protein
MGADGSTKYFFGKLTLVPWFSFAVVGKEDPKPVTDAVEILWRVEQCLKDAAVSSLLGLAWLRGPKGAQSSPRGPGGAPV